jgi:hypothetical protein
VFIVERANFLDDFIVLLGDVRVVPVLGIDAKLSSARGRFVFADEACSWTSKSASLADLSDHTPFSESVCGESILSPLSRISEPETIVFPLSLSSAPFSNDAVETPHPHSCGNLTCITQSFSFLEESGSRPISELPASVGTPLS